MGGSVTHHTISYITQNFPGFIVGACFIALDSLRVVSDALEGVLGSEPSRYAQRSRSGRPRRRLDGSERLLELVVLSAEEPLHVDRQLLLGRVWHLSWKKLQHPPKRARFFQGCLTHSDRVEEDALAVSEPQGKLFDRHVLYLPLPARLVGQEQDEGVKVVGPVSERALPEVPGFDRLPERVRRCWSFVALGCRSHVPLPPGPSLPRMQKSDRSP